MDITFAPKGILQIDNARLIFKNFSGKASEYNKQGDRNFCIVIPTEKQATALLNEGWNVHIKPARNDEEEPLRYLKVKVNFNDYGPNVFVQSGSAKIRMTEDKIHELDNMYIANADMDIRPYAWSRSDGRSGISAYLQSMRVRQEVDRFQEWYDAADNESPQEDEVDEDLPF